MGCEPVPQVGVAGYFVDIGIEHPQWPHGYLLGVECDGANYHSAKSARDRDRLRQEVLEGLGWRLHRIWSTDWFSNPKREAERLRQAIAQRLEQLKAKEQDYVRAPAAETKTAPAPAYPASAGSSKTPGQYTGYRRDTLKLRDSSADLRASVGPASPVASQADSGVAIGDTVRVTISPAARKSGSRSPVTVRMQKRASSIAQRHSPKRYWAPRKVRKSVS